MTLVEIMIALVVGLIIMTSAMSFTVTTFRGVDHTNLREDVFRTARFIGTSLERDAASAGVAIRSQVRFGTMLAKGDTLVFVSVPYDTLPVPLRDPAAPGSRRCTACRPGRPRPHRLEWAAAAHTAWT